MALNVLQNWLKYHLSSMSHNHVHNILRHFDGWAIFHLATTEVKLDCNEHGKYEVPHELPND